jgi:acetylglutamate kinase
MKEKLTVVKVGGAVVEDEAQLAQLLKDFKYYALSYLSS